MRIALLVVLVLAWLPVAAADDATVTAAEIDFLLTAVGDSGCSFIRNGKTHAAEDAEAHLRMKYRRGRRYVSTTEQFIERLASGSSISRKPYLIVCADAAPEPTGEWLFERLEAYREASVDG